MSAQFFKKRGQCSVKNSVLLYHCLPFSHIKRVRQIVSLLLYFYTRIETWISILKKDYPPEITLCFTGKPNLTAYVVYHYHFILHLIADRLFVWPVVIKDQDTFRYFIAAVGVAAAPADEFYVLATARFLDRVAYPGFNRADTHSAGRVAGTGPG